MPSLKEQPPQVLPTATRHADIPPPTELPQLPPQPDTASDSARPGGEGGDPHRQNQGPGEQTDALTQASDPHRGAEESVEDLLLGGGNGNILRTATDFYAELQSAGEYVGGGNGGMNGGAVHGSNQKESVFMRLNNRKIGRASCRERVSSPV